MEINTLEAALGFGAGVTFMAGIMHVFVVLPARARTASAELRAVKAEDELKARLIADLEMYRRYNAGAQP